MPVINCILFFTQAHGITIVLLAPPAGLEGISINKPKAK